MSKKTLSELYEGNLLSEPQADEFVALALKRQQRQNFKDLVRKEAKIVRLRWLIGIGIGVSVLLGVSSWVYFKRLATPPAPQSNVIYAAVTPKTIFGQLPAPTLADETLLDVHAQPKEDPVKTFKRAYAAQKYADCITLKAKIPSSDAPLQTLLAYCYLQTGDYDKSIALLEKLYAQDGIAKEKIRWWLGLAHGLAGDSPKMKKYLSAIQPEQHHYKEAQTLILN
jgi:tetratricopeptide (TPR) repeat protein